MNEIQDALSGAELLYGEYARLSQLSELALLRTETRDREIVASVGTVLIETTANALME